MKEPQRYSLSTGLPHNEDNLKVPMPSLYPEKMSNDIYSKEESAEQAFSNFIQKAKESKKRYEEKLAKQKKESNQN